MPAISTPDLHRTGGTKMPARNEQPPIPDPTILTTQQLLREVGNLRELLCTRIDAMEQATDLRIESWRDMPEQMKDLVRQLSEVNAEKFASISQQFQERDVRGEQAASGAGQALAAALQAAKELVGAQGEASAAAAVKSETSFTKQIDQIGTIIQTLEKALDARITELKERIDRGEGSSSGALGQRIEQREVSAQMMAVVVGLIIFVQVAVGIVVAFRR